MMQQHRERLSSNMLKNTVSTCSQNCSLTSLLNYKIIAFEKRTNLRPT